MKMSSYDRYAHRLWVIALLGVLGIGIAIRLIEVTYDRFDFDEYHLRLDIDKSLLEYYRHLEGTDAIQFAVHYWVTHRLLGGTLVAYRAASLAAGLAVLRLRERLVKAGGEDKQHGGGRLGLLPGSPQAEAHLSRGLPGHDFGLARGCRQRSGGWVRSSRAGSVARACGTRPGSPR